MAMNLCCPDFGTLVTTNTVSADGYEVENLLGRKTMWGQPKGFVAESFIKPPVDVTFMFPFNVWIQKILIDPKVGSQMSSGFEVFSASVSMPSCQQFGKPSSQKGMSGHSDHSQKPKLRTQSQMQSEKDRAVFASIGKAFTVDGSTSLFCFVNLSYQPMYPQITGGLRQEETKSGVVTRSLRYAQPGALTNVSHVTVRVNRATSGSVAIKSVQILGQSSRFCPKPTVNWFLQIADHIQNPKEKEKELENVLKTADKSKLIGSCRDCCADSPSKSAKNPQSSSDQPGCPEEFVDPITNDMLVLPVLLPSGHTVDSETLRKHGEAEALWGRPASDPFTGIPFSKGSKPLPNVKMKERLDRYLLKGGRNIIAPPVRDVGRSRDRATSRVMPAPASLVSSQQFDSSTANSYKEKREKTGASKCIISKESVNQSPSRINSTQTVSIGTIRSGKASKRKFTKDDLGQNLLSKRRPTLTMQRDRDMSVGRAESPSSSCHEEVLSQSLDSALESALSSLPSFNRQPTQECNKLTANSWSCSSCHRTLATRDIYHVNGSLDMYTLPCTHLICKECLLPRDRRAKGKCTVCDQIFEPSGVVKVHV